MMKHEKNEKCASRVRVCTAGVSISLTAWTQYVFYFKSYYAT